MSNFQISITYYLSQSGQKASLRAGGDGKSEQSISGEISLDFFEQNLEPLGWALSNQGLPVSPESRNAGVVLKHGETLADNNPTNSYRDARLDDCAPLAYDAPQSFEALMVDYLRITPARVAEIAAYNQQRAKIAAEKKEAEKLAEEQKRAAGIERLAPIVAAFLADQSDSSGKLYSSDLYFGPDSARIEIKSWHPQFAELREVITERKAAAEQAETERGERKKTQIAVWVAEHGDTNQQARFAEGLLPESEVVGAIEAEAFAAAAEWAPYEKITRGDVRATCSESCACAGCDNCSVEFRANIADSLRAEEFERLTELRGALPDAEITPRFHKGWCEDDDCKFPAGHVERLSLQAKITVGEFIFTREFAL